MYWTGDPQGVGTWRTTQNRQQQGSHFAMSTRPPRLRQIHPQPPDAIVGCMLQAATTTHTGAPDTADEVAARRRAPSHAAEEIDTLGAVEINALKERLPSVGRLVEIIWDLAHREGYEEGYADGQAAATPRVQAPAPFRHALLACDGQTRTVRLTVNGTQHAFGVRGEPTADPDTRWAALLDSIAREQLHG